MQISESTTMAVRGFQNFHDRLNLEWHRPALQIFMVIVLAHWAEHVAQAWQIYVWGWPVHHAGGLLGLYYPWLVHSELLHYGYALVMLIGIWILRKAFLGYSRRWWTAALVIQFWHHFEHLLLIVQATFHHNFFGANVPTSLVQLLIPRVELHLFYNTLVSVPMVAGVYYHIFSRRSEPYFAKCNCSWKRHELANASLL